MAVGQVNGIEIYSEMHGKGAPLLIIGGTGGDLRLTPAASSPFNGAFRTLSYDQRGLGRTSRPEGVYTMADYADDAAALIGSVGWDRCHVVGTSFGGILALNLAVRHPQVVDRLVLCCTSPGGAMASYPLHLLRDDDPDEMFATRMRLIDGRWDPAASEPIPGLAGIYSLLAAHAKEPEDPAAAAGLRRQIDARAGHDVVASLGAIAHETLVCAGQFDVMAPIENAQFMADRMPRATLRVFDGGHVFMVQDPSAHPAMVSFLLGDAPES